MPSNKTNIIYIILIAILFVGCTSTNSIKPYEKAFAQEDIYILEAINYEDAKEYNKASVIFGKLYSESNKIEYRLAQIKMNIKAKKYLKAKKLILESLEEHKENVSLLKLLVNIYLVESNYKDANKISLKILELEPKKSNYKLVANSFLINSDYDKALQYLEKAYNFDKDEEILNDIVTILYLYKNQKKKAISYLESHLRLHEINRNLALKLLKIYSTEKDVDGIISVYKLLYNKYQDEIYAKNLVDLYRFKGDTKSLISFLESSNYNPKLLVNMYQNNRDYKKALKLSRKVFKESNDYYFLAQEAMLEYEVSKNKSKKLAIKVTDKLKDATKHLNDPLIYNYIGYLYIDHDINIKSGIKWVKKALKYQKNSPYYLDSLAWGYYKIKDYKKAYITMKKVVDIIGTNDIEVKKHWIKIKKKYKPKGKK
jgi:tetratricopeptide (TPR) repeat protein